jgi:DNA-binding beta-propeller fold protein YncE
MVSAPNGIAIDSTNTILYVTDFNNNINKVNITSGKISILAGNNMTGKSTVVDLNTLPTIPFVIIISENLNYMMIRSSEWCDRKIIIFQRAC